VLSRLKLAENLRFVLVGWIGGIVSVLILGFLWPTIFPAILSPNHYYGVGPTVPLLTLFALAIATPFAWVGGLIGSRLPREGGRGEQALVAFIVGGVIVIPFACYGMWLFTGY
jgi:hypothetical protein